MSAFLECRQVSKIFGGGLFNRSQTTALQDISLEINVLETPIRKFGLARGRDEERQLMEETLRAQVSGTEPVYSRM